MRSLNKKQANELFQCVEHVVKHALVNLDESEIKWNFIYYVWKLNAITWEDDFESNKNTFSGGGKQKKKKQKCSILNMNFILA